MTSDGPCREKGTPVLAVVTALLVEPNFSMVQPYTTATSRLRARRDPKKGNSGGDGSICLT